MSEIQGLASEASEWFETATRSDETRFVRTKDGAPEWVGELVQAAHGDMFPDGWRYGCIAAALDALADDDGDDAGHEFADGHVDVYNGALTAWLASHLARGGYVDEAVEEFGWPGDRGIYGAIAMGQYAEALEVFESVRTSLAGRVAGMQDVR